MESMTLSSFVPGRKNVPAVVPAALRASGSTTGSPYRKPKKAPPTIRATASTSMGIHPPPSRFGAKGMTNSPSAASTGSPARRAGPARAGRVVSWRKLMASAYFGGPLGGGREHIADPAGEGVRRRWCRRRGRRRGARDGFPAPIATRSLPRSGGVAAPFPDGSVVGSCSERRRRFHGLSQAGLRRDDDQRR